MVLRDDTLVFYAEVKGNEGCGRIVNITIKVTDIALEVYRELPSFFSSSSSSSTFFFVDPTIQYVFHSFPSFHSFPPPPSLNRYSRFSVMMRLCYISTSRTVICPSFLLISLPLLPLSRQNTTNDKPLSTSLHSLSPNSILSSSPLLLLLPAPLLFFFLFLFSLPLFHSSLFHTNFPTIPHHLISFFTSHHPLPLSSSSSLSSTSSSSILTLSATESEFDTGGSVVSDPEHRKKRRFPSSSQKHPYPMLYRSHCTADSSMASGDVRFSVTSDGEHVPLRHSRDYHSQCEVTFCCLQRSIIECVDIFCVCG